MTCRAPRSHGSFGLRTKKPKSNPCHRSGARKRYFRSYSLLEHSDLTESPMHSRTLSSPLLVTGTLQSLLSACSKCTTSLLTTHPSSSCCSLV